MFGRKAKELEELLTQRNHENDLMRKRISELEEEVAKLREQEQTVVRAITEAEKTAARIVDEANAKADGITADAESARERLVAEAKQRVSDAAAQANDILAKAEAEAASIHAEADDYSRSTRDEADSYSENVRTDANIFVERTIMAAQQEVKKRKDVLSELNTLLRSTADYVSDQVLTFTDAIETSAKQADESSAELCHDIEKCSCSCSECAEPCVNASVPEPAAKPVPEPVNAPIPENEPPADDEGDSAEGSGAAVDPADLPDEYASPADLMYSIYSLEGRVMPNAEAAADAADDAEEGAFVEDLEGTPLDLNEPLPVDSELNKLVSEVLQD